MTTTNTAIRPYRIEIPQADLDDLRERLARTRWANELLPNPTGLASFAEDFQPARRLAERDHHNIISWNEYLCRSHWATQDAPDLLLQDIRRFYRRLR